MKRFQYRFEAVRRFREQTRDDARSRVAEAQQALTIINERIDALGERRHQLRTEMQGGLIGQISVDALLHRGRYDMQIELEHRELVGQREQIELEVERRRQRLTLAEQECRKFDRLKEIAREQHTDQQLRIEQAELDEMASQRSRIPPGEPA